MNTRFHFSFSVQNGNNGLNTDLVTVTDVKVIEEMQEWIQDLEMGISPWSGGGEAGVPETIDLLQVISRNINRNAWQSLACSPRGVAVPPLHE